MSAFRHLIAALVLVAWLPAVNACAVANAFPATVADNCCETESSAPAPSDSCADCNTLETGLPLSALVPLLAPIPDRHANAWLTDLLAALTAEAANKAPLFEHSAIPPEPPLWQFVARTAAPARGPSFV